jgi:hypothetical protein
MHLRTSAALLDATVLLCYTKAGAWLPAWAAKSLGPASAPVYGCLGPSLRPGARLRCGISLTALPPVFSDCPEADGWCAGRP